MHRGKTSYLRITITYAWVPGMQNWLPYPNQNTDANNFRSFTTVQDLIKEGKGRWNIQLLDKLFSRQTVELMLHHLFPSDLASDRITWTAAKDGDFPVISAYDLQVLACLLFLQLTHLQKLIGD
ncbi:hypothetical protein HS088_TW17G00660 [Tripterygium wilfordii]|uniref:Uncharacterized protein n=1 Tax=Tripterygium wilfordii TaxID=458696 RepID=A0A7J7CGE7_TRIWF|nr:hypothetical protein HS088_TW17G00660 [Tripterygium wilfordii]